MSFFSYLQAATYFWMTATNTISLENRFRCSIYRMRKFSSAWMPRLAAATALTAISGVHSASCNVLLSIITTMTLGTAPTGSGTGTLTSIGGFIRTRCRRRIGRDLTATWVVWSRFKIFPLSGMTRYLFALQAISLTCGCTPYNLDPFGYPSSSVCNSTRNDQCVQPFLIANDPLPNCTNACQPMRRCREKWYLFCFPSIIKKLYISFSMKILTNLFAYHSVLPAP